jgi:hypothetical protein
MFKLSVLITTKDRIEVLTGLVDSLVNRAGNLNDIEIIFGVDYDDQISLDYIHGLDLPHKRIYTYEPTEGVNRLEDGRLLINRHRDFINPMAFLAKGEYIWVLNDDVRIHTECYETIIYERLNDYLKDKKTKFVLAGGLESILPSGENGLSTWAGGHQPFGDGQYFCYPIINRYTLDKMEFFIPPEVASDSGDVILASIFKSSCVDRLVSVPVILEDIRYEKESSLTNKSRYNTYFKTHLMRDIAKIDREVFQHKDFDDTQGSLKCVAQATCGKCGQINDLPGIDVYREVLPKFVFCRSCFGRILVTPNIQQHVWEACMLNGQIDTVRTNLHDHYKKMNEYIREKSSKPE